MSRVRGISPKKRLALLLMAQPALPFLYITGGSLGFGISEPLAICLKESTDSAKKVQFLTGTLNNHCSSIVSVG